MTDVTGLIRVLYVMPTFGTGGAERLVSDLVQRLEPTRFRASVCVFEDGLLGEELAGNGYTVHKLVDRDVVGPGVLRRASGLATRSRRLRRILDTEHIDVIHTHFLPACLHAYMARVPRRRWRWVHTEHVRPDIAYEKWLLRLARWIVPPVDIVTGVSAGVSEYIRGQRWAQTPKVRAIYNGVDVDGFARPGDRHAKRREIGIPAHAWTIGTVGNLRPQKNHELLLEALARVLHEAPETWLVVAGGGERRPWLEARAHALGVKQRVLFLGERADVPELFAAFDVYCLASHFEGMPLSLFEAMAARKPIVATRVVGIEDVIRDGVSGVLATANDAEALSGALLRLHRDPEECARLVEAGWRQVNMHARLETMVQQYEDLYHQLMARAR